MAEQAWFRRRIWVWQSGCSGSRGGQRWDSAWAARVRSVARNSSHVGILYWFVYYWNFPPMSFEVRVRRWGFRSGCRVIKIRFFSEMGFNSVYKLLREEFQLIDARVLKAVAIEHSYDVNEAFNVVLDEIIPYERMRKASAQVIPISTPKEQNARSTPIATPRVRSIPITTPLSTREDAREQKSVDQKQLVEIASQVSSRTHDALEEFKMLSPATKNEHVKKFVNPFGDTNYTYSSSSDFGRKSKAESVADHTTLGTLENKSLDCSEMSHCLVAKTSDSQTDEFASKSVKDLVKDVEDDKLQSNLISALESVLNTLKKDGLKKHEPILAEAGDLIENHSNLNEEVIGIESRILTLLQDMHKLLAVLDDMRRSLKGQLSQAVEIEKAKLGKLQKQAQNIPSTDELAGSAAEENSKLRRLFKEYNDEVDVIRNNLKYISEDILQLKEKFIRRIPLSETIEPVPDRPITNCSVSFPEIESSESSKSSDLEASEDSGHSDSSVSEEEEISTTTVSANKSNCSESKPEPEYYEQGSTHSFEESDDLAQAKASNHAVASATPFKIISDYVQPDLPDTVSPQKNCVSGEAGYLELPSEAIPESLTDGITMEATISSDATKTPSEDGWDFCGHSDSDA